MEKNLDLLVYSQSEDIIKIYQYHSTSSKDKVVGNSIKNLIVTTKRIVLESKSTGGFSRDEFLIDFVESINTRFYHSKKNKIWLVFMLLGMLGIGLGIGLIDLLNSLFGGFSFVVIGISALMFIFGVVYLITKKPQQSFSLTLSSTKLLYEFSNISGENYIKKERKKGKKQIKIYSKITPAAVSMLNELNALILDIKDFKYQINMEKMAYIEKEITLEEYEERTKILANNLKDQYR